MVKDRRSRDQKRKAKLAKRRRNPSQHVSLAYTGNKYKTNELLPLWHTIESGILEAYDITDHELLDQDVYTALEELIRELQTGKLPSFTKYDELHSADTRDDLLVIASVIRSWDIFFERSGMPSKDALTGVLRSILGSIEAMRSVGPNSQGYLRHVDDFMTNKLSA